MAVAIGCSELLKGLVTKGANMSMIKEKIKRDFLFGCVHYKHKTGLYLMPIAYWILNYKKYDPSYNPDEWEFIFRKNILNVTDSNFGSFIKAIAVDKIDAEADLMEVKDLPEDQKKLYFFVNLDSKLFVNAFPEIEVENYLPDGDWTGLVDSPISYLSKELKQLF